MRLAVFFAYLGAHAGSLCNTLRGFCDVLVPLLREPLLTGFVPACVWFISSRSLAFQELAGG